MPQNQNQLSPEHTSGVPYVPRHAYELDSRDPTLSPRRPEIVAELGSVTVTSVVEKTPTPSPEAVKMLEEAKFSPTHKADMLLVSLGLRPATVLSFSEFYAAGAEPTGQNEDKSADIAAVAQALGLSTDTDQYSSDLVSLLTQNGKSPDQLSTLLGKIGKGDRPQRAKLDIFVGATEQAAQTLKDAWQSGEAVDGGKAMGLALGYPETAVESFATKANRAESMGDARADAFGQFALSSENELADKERAVALSWADAVEKTSPVIYDQVMHSRVR